MTRVQALLAVSYMASVEADAIAYALPETEDDWIAMLEWLRGPVIE